MSTSTRTPTVPTDTTATTEPAASEGPASAIGLRLVGVVLGLVGAVCLMVLAFLAPAINAGPHDLPIAVSGPEQAVTAVTSALDAADPDAFDVTVHDSTASVEDAVHGRDAVGGISIEADGSVTITTAGGAGTPYAALLGSVGEGLTAQGMTVTTHDVAPLTEDDPNGTGLSALAMPLAFGGMISAVLLSTVLKGRPVLRIVGAVLASLAVGFAVVAILQFGFGSVDGSYVRTSLALALGTSAISLFVLGMESLFGFAGLGIGGALMMFVGNPLSGMATGWQWLPSPWGFIGQLLPIGASGTLVRSAAFFDGQGAGMEIIVLSCWAVGGAGLLGLSVLRSRRRTDRAAVAAHPHAA